MGVGLPVDALPNLKCFRASGFEPLHSWTVEMSCSNMKSLVGFARGPVYLKASWPAPEVESMDCESQED